MTDSRNKANIITPAKIVITFKEKRLEYDDIFEYVRKIENIFGFIVGSKLNLISMDIFDNDFKEIRYRYLKEKKLCNDNESDLTDIHSIKLIKRIVKSYFEDEYISVCIDNYYEYLYNDLSSVLKFTSSISVLEVLAKQEKYLNKIKAFNKKENKSNKETDKIINKLNEKLEPNEKELINKLYTKNGISLRFILRFFFEKIFLCENNYETSKFIERIIKTRIYYVHGGTKNKALDEDELYYVSELLGSMIYLLIIKNISPSIFEKCWCIVEIHKMKIRNILKILKIS